MRDCTAGRGRQVISVCKSADLLLMVLDASKPAAHKEVIASAAFVSRVIRQHMMGATADEASRKAQRPGTPCMGASAVL